MNQIIVIKEYKGYLKTSVTGSPVHSYVQIFRRKLLVGVLEDQLYSLTFRVSGP